MSRPGRREALRGERGAMVITAALWIPVLLAFSAFVIVAAQWFVHKRHLQTQADAAALAGATEFAYPCDDSTAARISAQVDDYGGPKNPQVENGTTFALLNSPSYYGQTGNDGTPAGSPCDTGMIDVKMTEPQVTSLMGIGIDPTVNAHARVEVFTAAEVTNAAPIAVTDSTPRRARAMFVDEATGEVIASAPLDPDGTDAAGNLRYDNLATPVPVTVGSRRAIGVRIALSGQSSTTCGDPLVACYDGLSYVQGWRGDGSGAQPGKPIVRSVNLTSASCPDPYFSKLTGACNVGVRAVVDFGTGTSDPTTAGPKAALQAVVGGTPYKLSYASGAWTSGEVIPVAPGAGPVPVELRWAEAGGTLQPGGTCAAKNGNAFDKSNPCQGSFGTVQRSYSAFSGAPVSGAIQPGSGPIQTLQVWGGGAAGANTLRRCDATSPSCTYDLAVAITLAAGGAVRPATSPDEPPYLLVNPDANQTQKLDCDPANPNFTSEVAVGCGPRYAINTGTACPNRTTLWASAQPWTCVAIDTGNATGQVGDGLNQRILGSDKPSTCANPSKPGFGPNLFRKNFTTPYTGDPRLVQLLITPYGSFAGTGQDSTVPVTDAGMFYITGWSGSKGFANPCETNDIPSDPLLRDETRSGTGWVVGHFIKKVDLEANTVPSSNRCDFSTVTTCVAVLTQ